MKEIKNHKGLTGKQVRYLKGLGHHLKPVVMLGREGITDNVLKAANAVLRSHELVKVKIGNGCLLERRQAADTLAQRTNSEVVQILGKTILIYRVNPDRNDEHKIKLPG